jgi:hypothetical protein
VAPVEKYVGKFRKLRHARVIGVCPIKRLFEGLPAIVGVVLGIDAVRDDKELDVTE